MALTDKVDDWRSVEIAVSNPSPEVHEMHYAGLDIPVEQCDEYMLLDAAGVKYDDWREL